MEEKRINECPDERQPWETAKAYEAFKTYLDMGGSRSIRGVTQKLHKSYTLIGRWSRENRWAERIKRHENELAKEARRKEIEEYAKMRDRHIEISSLMQQKAVEALKEVDAKSLKPKDIKDFITVGTELERMNRMPDEDDPGISDEPVSDALSEAYRETVREMARKLEEKNEWL